MSDRILPREVHLRFVPNKRTGGTHNVLEVCGKNHSVAVRYVMAQDSETAKERDKYKLRAHLQEDRITELESEVSALKDSVRWIPVSEEPPKIPYGHSKEYLAVTGRGNTAVCKWAFGDWYASMNGSGPRRDITYWRDFPLPPVEQEKSQ